MNRVIAEAFKQSKTVYISISLDDGKKPVTDKAPIDPNCHYLTSDNSQLQKACDYIVAKLKQAKKVVTLPAIKLDRFGLTDKAIKLIEKLNIPFAIMPHDKSVISEHHKIM